MFKLFNSSLMMQLELKYVHEVDILGKSLCIYTEV